MLNVKFIDPLIFVSETQVYLEKNLIIRKAIPAQLSVTEAIKIA